MALIRTETLTCRHCGKEYIHRIYSETTKNSICPYCKKINDKCHVGRPPQLKSTILKECQNPKCDDGRGLGIPFLFYAINDRQKYCSKECYRQAEQAKFTERTRRWRKNNPERNREIARKYYKRNRKRILETQRKWAKNNPDKIKEYEERRKEKQKKEPWDKKLVDELSKKYKILKK